MENITEIEKLRKQILDLKKTVTNLKTEKEAISNQLKEALLNNENNKAFHKEFEYKLNSSRHFELKFNNLLHLYHDAVIFFSTDGVINEYNPAFIKLYNGSKAKDISNLSFYDIFTQTKNNEYPTVDIIKLIKHEKTFNTEGYFLCSKKNKIPVKLSAKRINNHSDSYAAIIRDLSPPGRHNTAQKDKSDSFSNLELLRNNFEISGKISDLYKNICSILLQNSHCDEVWVIDSIKGNKALYFTNNTNNQNHSYEETIDEELRNNILGIFPLGVNQTKILKNEKIIHIPSLISSKKTCDQLIFSSRLKKEYKFIIGLNYQNNIIDHNRDKEFLSFLFNHLKHAFITCLANEQLFEKEAKFRALTENIDDVIIIRDINGVFKYVSPNIIKYGYVKEDIIGNNSAEFLLANDVLKINSVLDGIIKNPRATKTVYNIRINLKNNKSICTDITFKNLLNEKGVNGIVALLHDVTQRNEYEEKLLTSEQRYRSFIENANDGIFLINNFKIIFVNKKIPEYFNIEEDKILGLDIFSPYYPIGDKKTTENRNAVIKEYFNDALSGKKVFFEWTFYINNEIRLYAHISLSKVEIGNTVNILGILRDITELKKAQKEIYQNELKLRSIFESMTDGVYMCSSDHSIEYMNKAMSLQLKVENPTKKKLCFNQIFGFETPCNWCTKPFLKPGENILIEVFNPKTQRHYQISKSLIKQNNKYSLLHISRDITELIKASNMILQNEEKFRNIFNYSNDAIFITDLIGNYLEVNNKAWQRAGFNKSEFLKLNIKQLDKHHIDNNVNEYLNEIIKTGKSTKELIYQTKNKKEIHTEISGRLINYEGNESILHVSRDISIRKELERQILESTIRTEENERSRFAKDLHDGIGPYLSATKFFLKTVVMEEDPVEREKVINKAIISIDEIIRNIKEISNNISPHVLKNFGLIAALKSFHKKLPEKAININIQSNIEGVRFDENLEITIFRILIELTNNTIKYANAKQASISANYNDNILKITFSHNGKGFELQKILKEEKGFGISNIINRVKSLKGSYNFVTSNESNLHFEALFNTISLKINNQII